MVCSRRHRRQSRHHVLPALFPSAPAALDLGDPPALDPGAPPALSPSAPPVPERVPSAQAVPEVQALLFLALGLPLEKVKGARNQRVAAKASARVRPNGRVFVKTKVAKICHLQQMTAIQQLRLASRRNRSPIEASPHGHVTLLQNQWCRRCRQRLALRVQPPIPSRGQPADHLASDRQVQGKRPAVVPSAHSVPEAEQQLC